MLQLPAFFPLQAPGCEQLECLWCPVSVLLHLLYMTSEKLTPPPIGDTHCFNPAGDGPDPNDCSVISGALRYDSQDISESLISLERQLVHLFLFRRGVQRHRRKHHFRAPISQLPESSCAGVAGLDKRSLQETRVLTLDVLRSTATHPIS